MIKKLIVSEQEKEVRLDTFLNQELPEYSRSFFKGLVDIGNIRVNNIVAKKGGLILKEGDQIEVVFPDYLSQDFQKDTSSINSEIIFTHPHFLIINKAPGDLVHIPNEKSQAVTLVDWLLEKFKDISEIGSPERPGIVHRLDMDTSGLMIVARTNYAHKIFSDMFKDRKIQKTYLAVVKKDPTKEGTIDYDIIRHPSIKTRMTHVQKKDSFLARYNGAKPAKTDYKVIDYFDNASLVEVKPTTGRTHQIRVHFAAIGHPLIGDSVYGEKSKLINRHALHASGLEFEFDNQKFKFEQPLPKDMQKLISALKK